MQSFYFSLLAFFGLLLSIAILVKSDDAPISCGKPVKDYKNVDVPAKDTACCPANEYCGVFPTDGNGRPSSKDDVTCIDNTMSVPEGYYGKKGIRTCYPFAKKVSDL